MNKNCFFLFFLLFGILNLHAQSIAKTWNYESATGSDSFQNNFSPNDILVLDDGRFEITSGTDSIINSGDYIFQNNVLVFF